MASRTSTDPLEILVEMGVDLDNLSEEEDYLSALIETTNALTIKSASDPRIRILQQEIRKVRQKRKAADTKFKARKTKISASKLTNKTSAPAQRKQMSSTTFFALPPATDQKKEEKKKGSPPNLLKEIAETTTRIADILKDQYNLKKDTATFDRKKAERERRDLQKKNLAKRFEGLKKVAEKIIAPVRGIFDRIMGFLFNILLGKFLMKLVDWFSNPDNKSKINSIIRFLSNNWPKLLSAYIIFGTGLGKFSRFIVKILARGAIRLAAATAGLLARLFGARSLGKFSRFLGKRGKLIAGGIGAVTTIFAFKALEGALTKGLGPEESASIDNDIPVSGYQGGGLVQPIFKFGGGGKVNLNLISPIGYNEGGEVDGPSGTDKVPAMLTDGEFVMSRGAVQKFGVGQLEAMNAAGGGTNAPKVMNGTVYAANGGYVSNQDVRNYRTGSLISDPLGALDRILGQKSSGKLRLPSFSGLGQKKPHSQPKPIVPPKTSKQETSADQTAMSIPEKVLKSSTFRDSGLLYLRSMLGGFGGRITEQDLSKASKDELNKAIARAKKRTASELSVAKKELAKAKSQGFNAQAIAERQSVVDRLKRGEVRVEYQDYYDDGKITPAAEDAKSILGKFWAATTADGGYKVVNEKYDFVDMKDPLAVLMGDSSGVSETAKGGQPITLRQRLQAMHQLNPFARDMSVDMVLGQEETTERKMNNVMSKLGGIADFFTLNSFDFDRQGGSTLMNPSGQKPKGKPQPEPSKSKLTAAQIKNNQAYAASKGKYYSSTTGKTYASYADALMDPQVAAGAKVAETKKKFSFAPNQQPNLTIPGMPTTGSNGSNVTVIKTSSKDKSPSGNTGGSEVPNANPGQGNRGKWNILGMSVPALF